MSAVALVCILLLLLLLQPTHARTARLGATALPRAASLAVLLASTVPLVLLWTTPVLLGAIAQPQQASLSVLQIVILT